MEDKTIRNIEQEQEDVYEVSLLDLLVILVEQRWFIAKVTTAFAVISIIYVLLATPIYKSTIQIMPPSSGSGGGAAAMLAASGMGDLVGALGGSTGDTVVGVIKSTAVLDKVIDTNSLLTRKPEGFSIMRSIKGLFSSAGEAKPKLRTNVRASLSEVIQAVSDKKSGIITVSVKDTSPDMAVKLTQSVYDETLSVLQTVAVTPEAQKRAFLETQLKENNKALTAAEHKLISYQQSTGMIAGTGTPSAITALGSLQARMVAKEIELKAAQRFATKANPQIKRLQSEYDAIKKQFEENRANTGTSPLSGVGVKKLAGASLEYASLVRDYKFRESLMQILLRQYENAKINEAQNPLIIQMLSEPTYPELRDSPRRTKTVILATILGCFLGIFASFLRHFMSMSKNDPETAPKIQYIKKAIASDLKIFKRK